LPDGVVELALKGMGQPLKETQTDGGVSSDSEVARRLLRTRKLQGVFSDFFER
jgi:hypothetical protein